MDISFDLDSTLIPHGNEFESEHRNWLAKLLGIEPIRKDSALLISALQKQGHHIHIYTTSFRSTFKIRLLLLYYGIRVEKIINEFQNQRTLKKKTIKSSKYPPAFGFDLHIDDSKGVGIEGEKFGFKTIIIKTIDKNWVETIKKGIEDFKV
ncbi:HAD family hydrolase [Bernardetia sp.]|uniref:HAD family hydrolase n=1 Tax=Bernardetia sp. TaxID=1937974 RepID=UPI0025BE2E9A|nr:HAD family hydrolase [Bernardetia sp.]